MFKLVAGDYFWPVKFTMPIDGGKHEEKTIDLRLKRLPQSEFDKALVDIQEGTITSTEFAKRLITGWKNVLDEENKEIPFSVESLDQFLEIPNAALAVFQEYYKSLSETKTKN
jgi:hypothetical protein